MDKLKNFIWLAKQNYAINILASIYLECMVVVVYCHKANDTDPQNRIEHYRKIFLAIVKQIQKMEMSDVLWDEISSSIRKDYGYSGDLFNFEIRQKSGIFNAAIFEGMKTLELANCRNDHEAMSEIIVNHLKNNSTSFFLTSSELSFSNPKMSRSASGKVTIDLTDKSVRDNRVQNLVIFASTLEMFQSKTYEVFAEYDFAEDLKKLEETALSYF